MRLYTGFARGNSLDIPDKLACGVIPFDIIIIIITVLNYIHTILNVFAVGCSC